jgi:indolepyruvate ferredoxin oxidoreductase
VTHQDVSLNDRYDLTKSQILLNGTQALVRLMLMQRARDAAAGLNTAGLVTGYRGSPLGAVDMQMTRAKDLLDPAQVTFQPGLNEDLAATALWGAQQAELRGEGKYDGVFGLWYGKGPGVDRSGDVMRHVNFAGTSPNGGVIMAMGDDHTGESSTTLHQSDWAMVDAYMPIVSPAGVQEVLDYGLYAYALSRFAGVWVGLKTMKDTIEVTSVVDGSLDRVSFVTPEFNMPDGGLNIRLIDSPPAQEARTIDHKRLAAEAFARANRMDLRKWGRAGAKIGFVAAGKNFLDLQHALSLLGLDAEEATRLGITTYKVGQTWPLDTLSLKEWAEGLDLIVVVEEKRKLIEVQIKEALFDDRRGRRVYGWHKGDAMRDGRRVELFQSKGDLNPVLVGAAVGDILIEEGCASEGVQAGLAALKDAQRADNLPELAARTPYFCSGCPHNSSTKVPEGSRAYAGIGCHYLVQFMDRETVGFTQMGGEGANWVGEAPFSTRDHVFQNIGDGTYNHSGVQAIRFAVMAGTNITYKILFNDAVAMTGGQGNDGGLTADQICRELQAMGVRNVALVYDDKEDIDLASYPGGLDVHPRNELQEVQEKCTKYRGVSAIVYVQTCAAEKRRRRKRGQFPDPDKRVFINTDICEGCGDCGVQSNCVSIVPVETELGRKRAIDQSSCNKDFSCVNGFCPSFVTIEGAKIRKEATKDIDLPDMPDPVLPVIDGTHNTVITGVGGTGVVTIGAVLAMAAHIDGKGAGMMEMSGLAQKGGAVHIHCRIGEKPSDINAIRVATGECDTLIGGDLVVSAGAKTIGLMRAGRTQGVVNAHEIMTGAFTRDADFRLPSDALRLSLEARMGGGLTMFDATALAKTLLGDSIYSNMMIFGATWQNGAIPVTYEAILAAIELNGTAVNRNIMAFEYGRWVALHPAEAQGILQSQVVALPKTLDEKIAFRVSHLTTYQGKRLARKYQRFVAQFTDPALQEAVALGYHKLLAYKDEYEVARLLCETQTKAQAEFEGDLKLSYHLAPPLMSQVGKDGRPAKKAFGARMAWAFPKLAKLKWLRGTPFDPFGRTSERRMERALIKEFEADLTWVLNNPRPDTQEAAIALGKVPLDIRGFGPVKEANARKAAKRREEILAVLRLPPVQQAAQ